MGIGKKGKEIDIMRKLTAVTVTLILIMSALFSAASCYAIEDDNNGRNTQITREMEDDSPSDSRDSQDSRGNSSRDYENDGNQTYSDKSGDDDDNDDRDSKREDDDEDKSSRSVTSDTSWFDYKNPKKKYNISSEEQLMGLASLVNQEQAKWKPTRLETFKGVTFTLTKDIKLTQPWTPIGSSDAVCFAGSFDGNGHTISNVEISSTSVNTGFFGYLKGEVKNLSLQGTIESTTGSCGGIVGELDSAARVLDCTSDIKITAGIKTGGIVGNNNSGTIRGCINKGDITGTYKIGGVVGENWGGTVENCGNEGTVSSSVRGVATFGTGGVAGRSVASTAIVSGCYNTGNIYSATEATGGVVGYTNAEKSTITDSYSIGNIVIRSIPEEKEFTKSWAGGVVGIVGTDGVIISNCYSSGDISRADISGGVIGKYIAEDDDTPQSYIENNYYLNEYCDSGIGADNNNKAAEIADCATGVTSGTLKSLSSKLGGAYRKDSSGLYGNSGYPVLRWQKPLSAEDKSYLEGVSKDVQIKLDKYLINNTEDTNKGDTVISIFNPDNYLADALLMYDEAKEQASMDEDAAKQNSQRTDDEGNAEKEEY